MKLLIFGPDGLLGNTIIKFFFQKNDYEVFGLLRDSSKIRFFKKNYQKNFFEIKNVLDFVDIEKKIKELRPNVIINCLGITNKNFSNNLICKYIQINSLFPHKLHQICTSLDIRLIHLSTDCIFSGRKGFYSETDIPDPIDFYGKSKFLGELNYANSITLRKSVIGHELITKNGLLEWFLSEEGPIEGYKNAIFSGLTVLELARIINDFILPRKDLNGIFNVSGLPISKYDLLKAISSEYQKSIKIIPNELIKIDRSLDSSSFNKCTGYKPKKWPELIKSMYEFNSLNS